MSMPMNIYDYGFILRQRYQQSLHKEKMVSVVLFGIQYGEDILAKKITAVRIAEFAGLSGHSSALSLGIKLSKHVKLKSSI